MVDDGGLMERSIILIEAGYTEYVIENIEDRRLSDKRALALLLFFAAQYNRTELIAPLLKAGADINGADVDAPLSSPLKVAALCGHTEMTKRLHSKGATINQSDFNTAAQQGHTDIIEFFMEKGMSDSTGWAFVNAAEKGHTETLKLLLKAGSDVNALESRALSYAAARGHTEATKFLLEQGAAINPDDKEQLLKIALNHKYTEITDLLNKYSTQKSQPTPPKNNPPFEPL